MRQRKKLYGGGIIIRERQWKGTIGVREAGAGAVGPKKISQYRKLSHSAEKTLFHNLIHCETISYPYTLPKNTNLIHYRNYTLS